MSKWWMCNVVWYDGCDAFVSKFILKADEDGVTQESEGLVGQMLNGNGEVLKIERLYAVDFDNIIALKDYTEQPELQRAYDRFKEMWFSHP